MCEEIKILWIVKNVNILCKKQNVYNYYTLYIIFIYNLLICNNHFLYSDIV